MAGPYDQVPLGQNSDPLSMPDNQINYAEMTRFQMISQYQQQMANYPRSSANYARMLSQPRFQYGVSSIDTRFYQRQAEVSRTVTGSGVAKGVADIGSFMAVAPLLAPLAGGAGMFTGAGLMAGFAAPMAVTAAPLYFLSKGIDRNIQRQRAMQSIASDVEQYRDRLGMSNMSYNEATQLGANLTSSMFSRGQFFNPEKQQEILKYGLANDMLSGKGRGMMSGDIKTFEKNFKELLKTVSEVSKTMKVTAEGAMSVVKEMQMGGFGNMGQISNSVMSAKAYGTMTGLGMQNMLNVGAAGAQAAQGTPWRAAAGANMYMGGVAVAGNMASGYSPSMQQNVAQVGGVAQAGGILAQQAMNIMKSGGGSRMLAYMMNNKMGLDENASRRLLGGGLSGHDVVTGASQNAHGWGISRIMFGRRSQEMLNNLAEDDPMNIFKMRQSYFDAWRSHRRGNVMEQAEAFGKTYGGPNVKEQWLLADDLLSNRQYSKLSAERKVAEAVAGDTGPALPAWKAKLRKLAYNTWEEGGIGGDMVLAGGDIADWTVNNLSGIGVGYRGTKRRLRNWGMDASEKYLGLTWDRRSIGSTETGYRKLLGLVPTNLTNEGAVEYGGLTPAQRTAAGRVQASRSTDKMEGWNAERNFANMTRAQIVSFYRQSRTAMGEGATGGLFLNTRSYTDPLGIKKGTPYYNEMVQNSAQSAFDIHGRMNRYAEGEIAKSDAATARENKFIADNPAYKNAFGVIAAKVNNMSEIDYKIKVTGITGTSKDEQIRLQAYKIFRDAAVAKTSAERFRGVDKFAPEIISDAVNVLKKLDVNSQTLLGVNTKGGTATYSNPIPGSDGRYQTGGHTKWQAFWERHTGKKVIGKITGMDLNQLGGSIGAIDIINQRLATGYYNPESMFDKSMDNLDERGRGEEVGRRRNEWKKLLRQSGVSTKGDYFIQSEAMTQKYAAAKNDIDTFRRSKEGQAVDAINNQLIRQLNLNDKTGDYKARAETAAYLSNYGILNSIKPTQAVANVLGGNTLGLAAGSEGVYKLFKEKQLINQVYLTPDKKNNADMLQSLNAEGEKIIRSGQTEGLFRWKDASGKERTTFGRAKALDEINSERVALEASSKPKDPYQNTSGPGLNSTVAAPILNYWNNKWSM